MPNFCKSHDTDAMQSERRRGRLPNAFERLEPLLFVLVRPTPFGFLPSTHAYPSLCPRAVEKSRLSRLKISASGTLSAWASLAWLLPLDDRTANHHYSVVRGGR
ncbi:hypothetical protein CPC08DRAFT_161518 [Agrocybe pediades]|nr:hypothetical protein CPC08DRAFT_161518 [Agrocybe pediades]